MTARFEVYADAGGKYRWRLYAGNNEIVASSGESFSSKAAARDGAEAAKRAMATAEVIVNDSPRPPAKSINPEEILRLVEEIQREADEIDAVLRHLRARVDAHDPKSHELELDIRVLEDLVPPTVAEIIVEIRSVVRDDSPPTIEAAHEQVTQRLGFLRVLG